MSRSWLVLGVPVAACFAASCMDATEVTLVITTSAECTPGVATDIFVSNDAHAEHASTCTPNQPHNDIGTLVLLPGPSGQTLVRLVATIDPTKATTEKCASDFTAAIANPSCVEAKRSVSFVPHKNLKLPINIDSVCAGIICPNPSQTCIDGVCKGFVTDCTQDNTCTPPTPDAGAPDVNIPDSSIPDTNVPDAAAPAVPTSVVAAANATCVVTAKGNVQCWGNNSAGAMGDPKFFAKLPNPKPVGVGQVQKLAMGASHSCALLTTGVISCWGTNTNGEVDPSVQNIGYLTASYKGMGGLTQVVVGDHHSCVIDTVNNVPTPYCWGDYSSGQLGAKAMSAMLRGPVAFGFSDGAKLRDIASGANHVCALVDPQQSTGQVFCWGLSDHGQAGDKQISAGAYIAAPGGQSAVAKMSLVAAGANGSFASDGATVQLWWGDDGVGQLSSAAIALGTFNSQAHFFKPTLSSMLQVAPGATHSCAVDGTHLLWCWGTGDAAGGAANNNVSTQTNVLKDVTMVAVGASHTCAIAPSSKDSSKASVYCFGDDSAYQLGVGKMVASTTKPVEVTLADE